MTAWTTPKNWGTATVTVADLNTQLRDNMSNIRENLITNEGWIDADETWTYASGTSFTIAGDYTTRYTQGVKLSVNNDSLKYFYVISSSGLADVTTVNITGGTAYVLADTSMLSTVYSRDACPYGFPNTFSYQPTGAGLSGTSSITGKFSLHGNECRLYVALAGTSNNGTFAFANPINSGTVFNQYNAGLIQDGGTFQLGIINSLTTDPGIIQVRKSDLSSFAGTGVKAVYAQLTYIIA
jgi:hypothetical protein